jgi:hypothetical protein
LRTIEKQGLSLSQACIKFSIGSDASILKLPRPHQVLDLFWVYTFNFCFLHRLKIANEKTFVNLIILLEFSLSLKLDFIRTGKIRK